MKKQSRKPKLDSAPVGKLLAEAGAQIQRDIASLEHTVERYPTWYFELEDRLELLLSVLPESILTPFYAKEDAKKRKAEAAEARERTKRVAATRAALPADHPLRNT